MPSIQIVVILLIPLTLAITSAFVPRRPGAEPTRLAGVWLVILAAAVTAGGDRAVAEWPDHQVAISRSQAGVLLGVCAVFAWRNRQARSAVVVATTAVAIGAGLNAAATLVFGGMPVLQSAALSAGVPVAEFSGPQPKGGYVIADELGWFAHYAGDFIPVSDFGVVVSIGDIILWLALAALVGMTLRNVAPIRATSSASAPKSGTNSNHPDPPKD